MSRPDLQWYNENPYKKKKKNPHHILGKTIEKHFKNNSL